MPFGPKETAVVSELTRPARSWVYARVDALCSADGQSWFTVGQVEFSVDDPVDVGLHAIGQIDRLIYPSAYPEGTAIRFESFDMRS